VFALPQIKAALVVRLYNIFTTSGAERSSESKRQARDQEDQEENDANAVNRGLVKHPKDWPWSSFSFYRKDQAGLVEIDPVDI